MTAGWASALIKAGTGLGVGIPEILDIAWLAERLPAGPGQGGGAGPAGPLPAGRGTAGPAAGAGTGNGTAPSVAGRVSAGRLDLYPRAAAAAIASVGGAAGAVPAPAVLRMLPDPIGLGRALRSLRRTRPAPDRMLVDDTLTAEHSAATGMVLPVRRAAPEPYYDLFMVCDTAPSMVLWERLLEEVAAGAARNGAFRTVTVRRLASDTAPVTLSGPGGGRTGFGELVEPNGRRIVAFFTDGVGGGWHDGQLAEHAHKLSGFGPVVVVHLLPEHLWQRTGIDPLPVHFRPAPDGAAGGTHGFDPVGGWRLTDLWPRGAPPGGGRPHAIPVVPLAAEPLARWASLVTGDRGRGVSGSAWIVGPHETRRGDTATPAGGMEPAGGRAAPETVLLREFDALASVRARRLLRFLSMAPLNLHTMWLVHMATSGSAGEPCDPAPLAEVFLSGLLRERRGAGAGSGSGSGSAPGDGAYEFVGDLRRLLYEGMNRDEAIDIFMMVSRHVTGLLKKDAPLAFQALLTSPDQQNLIGAVDPELRPLAQIGALILRGLGPAYRNAVEAIERAVEQGAAGRDASAGEGRPGAGGRSDDGAGGEDAGGTGGAEGGEGPGTDGAGGGVVPLPVEGIGPAGTGPGQEPAGDPARERDELLRERDELLRELERARAQELALAQELARAEESAQAHMAWARAQELAHAQELARIRESAAAEELAHARELTRTEEFAHAMAAAAAPETPEAPPAPPPRVSGTRIALLGAPSSGKTSFLGAVWMAAIGASEELGRWNVVAQGQRAERFIIEQTHHLTVARRFPEATAVPVAFTYNFRAEVPDRPTGTARAAAARPARGHRRFDFSLDFFDAGGAEFAAERYGKHRELADHLAGAQRILVLVDPRGSGRQAEYLAPHLERLSLGHRADGKLLDGRLPHQVAVCVSKFDDPLVFQLARRGGWVNQDSGGDPYVHPDDADGFAGWLAGSSPDTAAVRRLVGAYFLPHRVSWYVLSAVGFFRRPDGSMDLEDCSNAVPDEDGIPVLRGPARPLNVLEPLAALGRARDEG